MNCNCKNVEIGLSIIILIAVLVFSGAWLTQWIVVLAAILLLLHALLCKKCGACEMPKAASPVMKKTSKKKKK